MICATASANIRVLARVRPERELIEGVVAPALALLRFGAAPAKA
jgi:hypothetical protein